MELVDQRADADWLGSKYAASQRRVCGLMGIAVASYCYRTRRSDEPLRTQLVELARSKPRFGYRWLHVLLRRGGELVNHKRLHRIYREAGLMIRRKKRKHCVREGKPPVARTAANQEWALDFLHDAVECGRAIRVLSVVDAYTRECLALEVDTSFASRRVTRVLDAIVAERRQPQAIRCDNGPELTSRHFLAWCVERQIELVHTQPDAERTGGEFPRTAAGRVFDRELVSELVRCVEENRGLEDRVQRGAPAQQLGISNSERVCGGAGSGLLHN
jgi:putative transposase